MPMIVPAVAAAVTWVSSAAAIATGFLAAPLVGLVGEGAAIAIAGAGLKLTATALGALALNAVLSPRVGSAGSPTAFKADPSSPIRGVMGEFGTGGTQAHMRVWGKDNLMISFSVILSLGPIQGVDSFYANGTRVDFTLANGLAAQVEPYRDKMWQTVNAGYPSDPALLPPPNVGGNPAMEWGPNNRSSGYASVFWTMQNNSKRASYENGVPKPQWIVKGQKLYDPRLDSTQTAIGGSGAHRLDDWRTWTYTENPIIHALNWALGHHKKLESGAIDRTKLLAGVGAKIAKIDLPTFAAAANVSDMNSWKISGEWNTQDNKWQVLSGMLQAGSALPVHVGAKIGVMVNAPRVPVATITQSDILGNMNVKVMASRRDRFNTVYPRYINRTQGWEYSTAGAVTSSVYKDQDAGEERPKEITYNYVSQPKQAGQLAAYDLANTRESIKVAFPAKPYLVGIKPGDAVILNHPSRGFDNAKFIVMSRPIDLMEGTISMELRSETDSKHPWALGQIAQPTRPTGLSPYDPTPTTPDAGEWYLHQPEEGEEEEVKVPSVGIELTVPDGIGRVLVEYAETASEEDVLDLDIPAGEMADPGKIDPVDLPWQTGFDGLPSTKGLTILLPKAEGWYFLRISYFSVKGIQSGFNYKGPINSGKLISSGTKEFGGRTEQEWQDIFDQLNQAVDNLNETVETANAGFDAKLAELDSGLDGVQQINAQQTELINGKAEISALQAQISRIDNQSIVIGGMQTIVNDIPNSYTKVADYNTLKTEITNARGGSTNLSGRFTAERQFVLDGLAGKASGSDVSSLNVTVSNLGTTVNAQGSRITTVEADLSGKASTQSVSALSTAVSSKVTTYRQNTDPPNPNFGDLLIKPNTNNGIFRWEGPGAGWVGVPDTRVNALQTDVITLGGRVTTTEGTITDLQNGKASTQSVSEVAAIANGAEAKAVQATTASADALGKVNVKVGLRIDAGGYISGTESANNGIQSSFNIRADVFKVTPSGNGSSLQFDNGLMAVTASNGQRVFELTW